MTVDWDHSFRCRHCDGLNDLDAEWCMQCHRRLRAPVERLDLDAGRPSAKEVITGALDVVAGDSFSDEAMAGAFIHQGDGIVWRCIRCGDDNDVRAELCASCGSPFTVTARGLADADIPKKKTHAMVKAVSIVLGGSVLMRVVAGLISPWAAAGLFTGVAIRGLVRWLRT